jgi:hypothetical protein
MELKGEQFTCNIELMNAKEFKSLLTQIMRALTTDLKFLNGTIHTDFTTSEMTIQENKKTKKLEPNSCLTRLTSIILLISDNRFHEYYSKKEYNRSITCLNRQFTTIKSFLADNVEDDYMSIIETLLSTPYQPIINPGEYNISTVENLRNVLKPHKESIIRELRQIDILILSNQIQTKPHEFKTSFAMIYDELTICLKVIRSSSSLFKTLNKLQKEGVIAMLIDSSAKLARLIQDYTDILSTELTPQQLFNMFNKFNSPHLNKKLNGKGQRK